MTTGTEAYLGLVIFGFLSFIGVLFYASLKASGQASDER